MGVKLLVWISRVIFGIGFIFAGFTKAIDPLGSVYKIEDYFLAFGLEWLFPVALPAAILLNTLEFVVGATILLGLKMKLSAWLGLLFMAFFTPLTLYIAITDPVPHCGCFGDAWIISNWETFYKNLVLLTAAIIIFKQRNKIPPLWPNKKDWWIIIAITVFIISLSFYCLRNLPIIDFRPWKAGNDVTELVIPTEEVVDVYLIFENKKTGETEEYSADDYPWDDPEWVEKWKYVDQRRDIIQPYEEAEISEFEIIDEFEEDYTEVYITNPQHQFILIAYDLHTTYSSIFTEKINDFAKHAEKDGHSFIVLTGSSFQYVDAFRHEHQTSYPFYQSDPTELKTIVRSNPGLLLMKDGVVLGKWHHRNIPDYDKIKTKYLK